MDNNILRAVRVDNLVALDVDQKVEMLKEVCFEERDGDRS